MKIQDSRERPLIQLSSRDENYINQYSLQGSSTEMCLLKQSQHKVLVNSLLVQNNKITRNSTGFDAHPRKYKHQRIKKNRQPVTCFLDNKVKYVPSKLRDSFIKFYYGKQSNFGTSFCCRTNIFPLTILNRTMLFHSKVPNINEKKLRKNTMLALYASILIKIGI